MKFDLPSTITLRGIGAELGFPPDGKYTGQVRPFMEALAGDFSALDELPANLPAAKYRNQGGYTPTTEENKHVAWGLKTLVKGTSNSRLLGKKTVALKDPVGLADIPMISGASALEGYVPDMDATIVTRSLNAGAEILGKGYVSISHYLEEAIRVPMVSSTARAILVIRGVARKTGVLLWWPQGMRTWRSGEGKPGPSLYPRRFQARSVTNRPVASNALFLEVMAGEDRFDPRQPVPADCRCTQLLDTEGSN